MHTGSICDQTWNHKQNFDAEVIFHVLFLLGREESSIFGQIRNQLTPFQKIFSPLNHKSFYCPLSDHQMLVACTELSFKNEKQGFS